MVDTRENPAPRTKRGSNTVIERKEKSSARRVIDRERPRRSSDQ